MNTRSVVSLALAMHMPCKALLAQPASVTPQHFEITLPDGAEVWNGSYAQEVTISPDGRYVVFTNRGDRPARLYRRDLRDGTTAPIAGVDRGAVPFLSPDGRWLAFVAAGSLWKVPIDGGDPVKLAPIENFFGGAWGPDGTIVYAPEPGGGLYTVSASGGEPKRLTESGWFPTFLPDGRSVVFNSFAERPNGIAIVDIRSGRTTLLPITGRAPQYVSTGHLLFGRDHDLWAVPFDPTTHVLSGDARVLLRNLSNGLEFPRQFAVAGNGTLVFIAGGMALRSEPVRVDLEGAITPIGMPPQYYRKPRISPDGSSFAYAIQDAGRTTLWVADAGGASPRQVTSDDETEILDWMPHGESLLIWKGPNPGGLYALPVSEGREERILFSGQKSGLKWVFADGTTPDGAKLVGRVPSDGDGNGDIALLATDGSGQIERLEGSTKAGVEHHTGTVSPDGKWLAFVSDKSGARELYVTSFARSGAERQVSGSVQGWAFYPEWSPDSHRLYYVQGGQMWSAEVGPDSQQPITSPQALFELPNDLHWHSGNYTLANFDLTPDGGWFLMLRGVGEWQAPKYIGVVTHVDVAIEALFAPDAGGPR